MGEGRRGAGERSEGTAPSPEVATGYCFDELS